MIIQNLTATAVNPQISFFDNFPMKDIVAYRNVSSNSSLSFQHVELPLSLSLNTIAILMSNLSTNAKTVTFQFGLYSLNGGTLSLENSASRTITATATFFSWISITDISKTQNMSPGQWYWGFNVSASGNTNFQLGANSSINPANANPMFDRAHVTASTNALPASIATSVLDQSGADANKQFYIVITA